MKGMKYRIICLAVLIMLICQTAVVMAAEGSVTYGSASYSPTEGQEFQVGVYVNGSEAIGAYEFYLDYNADMLEYVSGADSGGGGRLKFVGYGNASSYNYMLTFKAKTAGSSNISISNAYLGPFNPGSGDSMTITAAASAEVNIQGPSTASSECRLSELSVAPTGLWGFSSDKTEYDITVDNDISKLNITATPMSSSASVVISDTNLAEGVNTITIKVTAENGTVKNYSIIVRRKPAEAETPTTTAVSDPDIDNLSLSFLVNGKDMYVTENVEGITAPDGFQKTTVTYREQEIPAFTSLTQNITLFYLQDGLGENGAFYAYNSAQDNVYPYIRLTNAAGSFMIVSPEAEVEAPEGYQETTLALSNGGDENVATTIQAWIQGGSTEFFLIYALNDQGECSFYQYDTQERTLQRYHASVTSVKPEEQETTTVTEEEAQRLAELEASVIKLKLNHQVDIKNKLMIIIVLAVLCVVLIIAVIGLIFKLKGQAGEEPDDDEAEDMSYVTEHAREMEQAEREAAAAAEKAQAFMAEPQAGEAQDTRRPENKADKDSPQETGKPAAEKKIVQEDKKKEAQKETEEPEDDDDFLMDLDDDDDFTFFDYDDDK